VLLSRAEAIACACFLSTSTSTSSLKSCIRFVSLPVYVMSRMKDKQSKDKQSKAKLAEKLAEKQT